MARHFFAIFPLTAHKAFVVLALITSGMTTLPNAPLAQSQGRTVTPSETLGVLARQVMIDIFRNKDATASIGILARPSYSMTRILPMVLLE